MSALVENSFRSLLRQRMAALLLIAASLAIAVWGASKVDFDARYRDIFRSSSSQYQTFQSLVHDFDAGENTILVLFEAQDVLSRESLRVLASAHNRVERLAVTDGVASVFQVRRSDVPLLRTFPRDIDRLSDARLTRAVDRAMEHPFIAERLVSADRRASLLAVRLSADCVRTDDVATAVADVRAACAASTARSDVAFGLTGLPVIRVETVQSLKRENVRISLTGALLATVALAVIFRSVGAVVAAGLPALIGVLWTFAVAGFCGHTLGTFDIVVPALLIVIGDADAIHLLSHMRQKQAAGWPSHEAAMDAVRRVGPACLLTSLTTAIGFGSLALCDDQMVRDFGLFAALGVGLTFVAVMIVTPLLGSFLPTGNRSSRERAPSRDSMTGFWDRLFAVLSRRSVAVAACGIALTIVCSVASTGLRTDWAFTENFARSSPQRQVLKKIETQFGGLPLVQVLVDWPATKDITSPEVLELLREVHRELEACPLTSSPFSVLTAVQAAEGNAHRVARQMKRSGELASLVSRDRTRAIVVANVPERGATALETPLNALQARLQQLARKNTGFRVELTGFAVLGAHRTKTMLWQLLQSVAVASVVILVVLVVAFRSLWLGLASILPNGLPLLATAALLMLLGIPLQFASVLVFSICLGIAVDDTIHLISRYQHERSQQRGHSAAVRHALRRVGPALITTTVVLLMGFAAACFSPLPTVCVFGTLACLALLTALAADVVLLPALLLCIGPRLDRAPVEHPAPVPLTSHLQHLLAAGHLVAWLLLFSRLDRGTFLSDGILAAIPVLMTIHQLEEHVFTEWVLGRRYAFLRWVETIGYSIGPLHAIVLNCGVAWTMALASWLSAPLLPWLGLFVLQVEAVNGVWHVATALGTRRWSPGIVSSVTLTVPAAAALTFTLLRTGQMSVLVVCGTAAIAVISHALFLNSLPRASTRTDRPACPN